MATRALTSTCKRCGIHHTCTDRTRPEWRDYCADCRPEAKLLGWIPRKRAKAA